MNYNPNDNERLPPLPWWVWPVALALVLAYTVVLIVGIPGILDGR